MIYPILKLESSNEELLFHFFPVEKECILFILKGKLEKIWFLWQRIWIQKTTKAFREIKHSVVINAIIFLKGKRNNFAN